MRRDPRQPLTHTFRHDAYRPVAGKTQSAQAEQTEIVHLTLTHPCVVARAVSLLASCVAAQERHADSAEEQTQEAPEDTTPGSNE